MGSFIGGPRVRRLDSSDVVEGVVIIGGSFNGGVEERAPEAQGGGSGGGDEERVPEASTARQPRSDLGKSPLVAEEPLEPETLVVFVGTGTGAGSSQPIGMGDFLEVVSVEDLAESLRGEPGLAAALLPACEEELRAEVEARMEEERRVDKEDVLVPRRTVIEEVRLALSG